jgi:mono/diheme cytochrome c family protein
MRIVIPFIIILLILAGCGAPPLATPSPTPTLPPQLAQGQRVFKIHCGSCHSLQPDLTIIGPSLAGIATRAADRVDGQDARTYIYTAILNPNAYTVPGFEQTMPTTFGKTLTGEDLDAVVAYLLTMK